jgi:hypothetical protein
MFCSSKGGKKHPAQIFAGITSEILSLGISKMWLAIGAHLACLAGEKLQGAFFIGPDSG